MDDVDRGLEPYADEDGEEDEEFDAEDDEFEEDADGAATLAAADPVEELRGLVVYLATNLVDEPDAVEVMAERRGPGVHLSLRVPEEELGKVIGRQGRIARAMRTALMIAGSRTNLRASLDIEG